MASPEIALLLELVLDLKKDQSEIKDMTIKNSAVLEEHTRRSTASEERIERLEQKDQMLSGFIKISGGLLGLLAAIAAIVEVIRSR